MADSKKYNGNTWLHSLRKLGTDTNTITTLPADLYADGNNATVGLVGNMYQASGVSPTTPIQPSECGERTGNLLFKKIPNANISSDGKIVVYSSGYDYAVYVAEVEEGKTYTTGNGFSQAYALYTSEPNVNSISYNGSRSVIGTSIQNITIPTGNDIKYIALRWTSTFEQAMFNEGTTHLPYEPYGYKLDIKSGNTTTPVYLGEVETTRKIKKLVFDGTEDWKYDSTNFYLNISSMSEPVVSNSPLICSHFVNSSQGMRNGTNWAFVTLYPSATSANEWKAYLQQQYAAGTPVCVWYVLATETTGIVNEPLRKIGDYVDTVSGITIPTITGKDTFDVLTTLKPSEVELTYTGWHDAEVKEWDGSQWQ